jgi:hypothetical protein
VAEVADAVVDDDTWLKESGDRRLDGQGSGCIRVHQILRFFFFFVDIGHVSSGTRKNDAGRRRRGG